MALLEFWDVLTKGNKYLTIDASGCLPTIDIEHYKQHTDKAWTADIELTLTDATPQYLHFVPGNYETHLTDVTIIAEKTFTYFEIWKEQDVTPGTTEVPVIPSAVNGPSWSGKIFSDPTVTVNGGLLNRQRFLPVYGSTGVGQTSSGGSGKIVYEDKVPAHYDGLIMRVYRPGQTGTAKVTVCMCFYDVGPFVPTPS